MKKRINRSAAPASHKRTATRTVALQVLDCRILGSSSAPVFRAHLINISSTGIQIYSHKPLEEKAEVVMPIHSKDGEEILEFKGVVVWARKNALKLMGRYAYGVHFLDPTPAQKAFISDNFTPEDAGEGI